MAHPKMKPQPTPSPSPKGGFRHSDRANIPEASLTFREKKVLAELRRAGEPVMVRDLARRCFPGMRSKPNRYESKRSDGSTVRHGTAAAYRCVLNSMRRLVAGGFALKVATGTYRALTTPSG